MKFSSLKFKAILFMILIAFSYASNLSKRSTRGKQKSMKITRRIQAKKFALRTKDIQSFLDGVFNAATTLSIEFLLESKKLGSSISCTGTYELGAKAEDKKVVWESKVTVGTPQPDKILKGVIAYVTASISAALAKWVIASITPYLGPIFWVFTAIDALGAVLTFLDKLAAKVTEGTLDISFKFEWPIIGPGSVDYGIELSGFSSTDDKDEAKAESPLLSFSVEAKMSFDKAKATEAGLTQLLGEDEGGKANETIKFLKDIIKGMLKVIKMIQGVKAIVGKVIQKILVDVVYEVLSGMLQALAVAFMGQEAYDALKSFCAKLFKGVIGLIKKVLGTVTEAVGKVAKSLGLDKFFGGILLGAAALLSGAVLCVGEIINGAYQGLVQAWDTYKSDGIVAAVAKFTVVFVQGIWSGVKALGKGLWNAVKKVGEGLLAAVTTTYDTVKKAAKSVWNWISSWFRIMRQMIRLQKRRSLHAKRFSKYQKKSHKQPNRRSRQHTLSY